MLNYDTLVKDACKAIPEFSTEYNRAIADDIIDETSGNHTVFSYVFVPLLKRSVKMKNKKLARKMLSFVEEMEKSKDNLVGEVSECTVVEEAFDVLNGPFLSDEIGPETRKSIEFAAGLFNIAS